jgi:predicted transcriptional regulator
LFPNDLAIRGTLAKLDFEKKKKQLGLTDADVVRLIGVDEKKFARMEN